MQRILTQQFSFYLILATCAMHVLCCGLPLLLSIGSLATVAGAHAEWAHPHWLEQYEFCLMAISGAVLLFTGAIQSISNRINCRTDGHCHHKPCDKKKALAQRVFWVAVVLYVANIVLLQLTH
jgi:hypothetical protein